MKRDEYCTMIREVMRSKNDPTGVAYVVLRDTGPEDWKAMACLFIESYVRDRQRANTLNIERSTDPKPKRRDWLTTEERNRMRVQNRLDSAAAMIRAVVQVFEDNHVFEAMELRQLVAEPIADKSGDRTTWGEAGIDFHRERIVMLNSNALAQLEAVARHECAIRTIEHYGVSCLNEALTKAA